MLDPKEMEALETWRYNKHMPSRAASVRELLRRGLAAEGFKFATVGASSNGYGVLETPISGETE